MTSDDSGLTAMVPAMLDLVGTLAIVPNDRAMRCEALVRGLCRLVGAKVGIIAQLEDFRPGVPVPRHVWGMDFGFTSEHQRRTFFASLQNVRSMMHPVVDRMRPLADRIVSVRRRDVMGDEEWYASEFFLKYSRQAGVDDMISLMHPIGKDAGVVGIGLFRPVGAVPFGEVDLRVAAQLNESLAWFFRLITVPTRSGPPSEDLLPMRLKRTLEHLLAGQSEKQVARAMGISHNSVHQYVKQVYRHFGVTSRPELLARLLEGGPGSEHSAPGSSDRSSE